MTRLAKVEVGGLFGYMRHEIDIRPREPTMLTAPNGAGKTHVLMLLRAGLSLDVKGLLAIPFSTLRIVFDDSRELVVERSVDTDGMELKFVARKGRRRLGQPATVRDSDLEDPEAHLPSYIRPLGGGRWYDTRIDRTLTQGTVERRYRVRLADSPERRFRDHPEILRVVGLSRPILIDTKRLDAVVPQSSQQEPDTYRPGDSTVGSSSIGKYIDQIRIQVVEARRSSIQATQSADLSFAARALAAANKTVQEEALHQRYDEIVDKYEDLARNGLATGEAPMDFPEQTSPTVRRILSVFLDDWEKRLEPLLPLNEKIKTLREILDSKLEPSGKQTAMAARGQLTFQTFTHRRIRVSSLSSGEQHLVALFTLLLFTAERGSVVLIDEPEISMHAAWKHAFLEDISRVAALADLQIILATHSTAIVNGQWQLTEELTYTPGPQLGDEDGEGEVETDDELV